MLKKDNFLKRHTENIVQDLKVRTLNDIIKFIEFFYFYLKKKIFFFLKIVRLKLAFVKNVNI